MDIRKEAVREYLEDGIPYRALAKKYNLSRSTINKWVLVRQGIHGLDRTHKQQSHYLRDMDDPHKKRLTKKQITADDLQKKIAVLEKQLQWEKLRADALDTMINVAEEKLNISIRKKSGSPPSKK